MKKMIKNISKYGLLALIVPLTTGCGPGQIASLGLGSLFAGAVGGSEVLSGAPDAVLLASAGHNPEPASMLLLGSGMAAMAYFKGKKKSNIK